VYTNPLRNIEEDDYKQNINQEKPVHSKSKSAYKDREKPQSYSEQKFNSKKIVNKSACLEIVLPPFVAKFAEPIKKAEPKTIMMNYELFTTHYLMKKEIPPIYKNQEIKESKTMKEFNTNFGEIINKDLNDEKEDQMYIQEKCKEENKNQLLNILLEANEAPNSFKEKIIELISINNEEVKINFKILNEFLKVDKGNYSVRILDITRKMHPFSIIFNNEIEKISSDIQLPV